MLMAIGCDPDVDCDNDDDDEVSEDDGDHGCDS